MLPPELLTSIFEYLDLQSLINISRVCKHFRTVCSDPVLNPWREQIEYVLRCKAPPQQFRLLQHLGWYTSVPKENWLHILAVASPEFILFSDIPPLAERYWEQAFQLRFLPSWVKWKKENSWKRAFKMLLWRVWHRLTANCTADESWTNYVILSRQGIVNSASASSRSYEPHDVLDIYKHQNNLAREPSTTRLIVQLADVRIIAIGTLGQVSSYQTNRLAKEFVHPSGIYPDGIVPLPSYDRLEPLSASSDTPQYYKIPITQKVGTPITRSLTLDETTSSTSTTTYSFWRRMRSGTFAARESVTYVDASTAVMGSMYRNLKPSPPTPRYYSRLTCPNPYYGHRNFPNFTLGGQDLRWPEAYDGTAEEVWVGPMLITAVLVSQTEAPLTDGSEELLRRIGRGRGRWVSFTTTDLDAIAPWLSAHIEKRVEGMGLGN
ncbi:hypothetical protein FRC15_003988 [Serendipita sp. 397]|nr:hypothetical protein FRC15_003988 [Serendipita sp. 397]KAG8814378.1 hypothetical protein FRC18_001996 [Serendipita sp. 400]